MSFDRGIQFLVLLCIGMGILVIISALLWHWVGLTQYNKCVADFGYNQVFLNICEQNKPDPLIFGW
jgi:uncharacterized membrane protein YuzA (DUF378 family)